MTLDLTALQNVTVRRNGVTATVKLVAPSTWVVGGKQFATDAIVKVLTGGNQIPDAAKLFGMSDGAASSALWRVRKIVTLCQAHKDMTDATQLESTGRIVTVSGGKYQGSYTVAKGGITKR